MVSLANPDQTYRRGVGIALFNAQGKVLVAERLRPDNAWQMPQGGLDPGEGLHEAALRELKEEVGTSKANILAITREWLTYDFPDYIDGRPYGGRFRGQAQKWVAARFFGQDHDINLRQHRPFEFKAWRWCELDELMDLIVHFKRPVYDVVVRAFRPFATPGPADLSQLDPELVIVTQPQEVAAGPGASGRAKPGSSGQR